MGRRARLEDRARHAANWLNLTTPVGLLVAALGGARVRRRSDGILLAEGYRFRFPPAGAFTIGDVVITAGSMGRLEERTPGVLGHEVRHAWQYAVAGVWFLPAYLLGSAWSLARTGSPALANPLERHAGLVAGGYVDADTGAPTFTPPPKRGLRPWRRRAGDARTGSAGGARADGAGA